MRVRGNSVPRVTEERGETTHRHTEEAAYLNVVKSKELEY